MLSRCYTVAFNGLQTIDIEVQVQLSAGMPTFTIVGLPDKAVAESRERIRAALFSLGIKLPPKRITVNLAPADIVKEGTHYDLPLALGILSGMGIVDQKSLASYVVLGELGLDGKIVRVNGVLPAAVMAQKSNKGLICPAEQGKEAVCAGGKDIVPAASLEELINFLHGNLKIEAPEEDVFDLAYSSLDMRDVKGQESAKRALEIAAAGGHNVIMVGPPGSGKSMLAARLPSILPPMNRQEALETSMIASIAGELKGQGLIVERPFRAPHHSASTPALVGGGRPARPGDISLANNGILFLDELPEFARSTLEALRQPLETGKINISRVNSHIEFPAKIQLIAAMNPCRCGYLGNPARECARAPRCAQEYQSKISGPLLDRIDIQIEVPAVSPWDMASAPEGEHSEEIRKRVIAARKIQYERNCEMGCPELYTNSELNGEFLEKATVMDSEAKALLVGYADKTKLSARGYNRTLRLARTIADLQNENILRRIHIAEALSLRWKVPDYKF
ncbi:MAG: YifB family Mg chelatase-like AAA ATPase [Alphaproteobacteria bacterium]|nr:YifB family Mg chelatase-like AAA ATPase [Alphaproteobacteria bacterium]